MLDLTIINPDLVLDTSTIVDGSIRKFKVHREGYNTTEAGEVLFVLSVEVTDKGSLSSDKIFIVDEDGNFVKVATLAELSNGVQGSYKLQNYIIIKAKSLDEVNSIWNSIDKQLSDLASELTSFYEKFVENDYQEYPRPSGTDEPTEYYNNYLAAKQAWQDLVSKRDKALSEYNILQTKIAPLDSTITPLLQNLNTTIDTKKSAIANSAVGTQLTAFGKLLSELQSNDNAISAKILMSINPKIQYIISDLQNSGFSGALNAAKEIQDLVNIVYNYVSSNLSIYNNYFVSNGEILSYGGITEALNEIQNISAAISDIDARVKNLMAVVMAVLDGYKRDAQKKLAEIQDYNVKIDQALKVKNEAMARLLEKFPDFDRSLL